MERHTTTAAIAAAIALVAASCGSGSDVRTIPHAQGDEFVAVTDDEPANADRPARPNIGDGSVDDRRDATTSSAPEPGATEQPEQGRPVEVLAELDAALRLGDCATAIARVDALLAEPDWQATDRDVARLLIQRDDCARFLELTAAPPSPETLTSFVQFRAARPAGSLVGSVERAVRQLYGDHGTALLSVDSCTALDGQFTLLSDPPATAAMAACATAFSLAGRSAEAISLANDVIALADDTAAIDLAIEIVAAVPETCGRLTAGGAIVDPAAWPDQHARLLLGCMDEAAGRNDLDSLARLQIAFLSDLPDHAAAGDVSTAMLDNVGACAHLAELVPPGVPSDVMVSKLFSCAQFADFVGDRDRAIELYRSFLAAHPDDPRAPEATAGLARNLIARARAGDTAPFERPARSGSTGDRHAALDYSNDTPYDQQIVLSGPDARIITVPASPTSVIYDTAPRECRSDVPTVTIDVAPGTYDIMISDDVTDPEIGTWTLAAGAEYGWCSWYVWVT